MRQNIETTASGETTGPVKALTGIIATGAFQYFYNKISQAGFLLFAAAVAAFIWSNLSPEEYRHFWHQELSLSLGEMRITHSLAHWVNEALMTVFFFTVGLEIKREVLVGGLSDPKKAALPVAAAVGGMLVPALFYFLFNRGSAGLSGWGIPMATDIAFSLAVLSTLGKRVPFGIRLFLTAFAIADDLGAILVIAFFYTPSISLSWLAFSGLITVGFWVINSLGVRQSLPYLLLGAALWYSVAHAGLHATISGVIAAMFIPLRGKYHTDIFLDTVGKRLKQIQRDDDAAGESIMVNRVHLDAVQGVKLACKHVETPLQRLEHSLSSWVGYLVLPLFALANAGVVLGEFDLTVALLHPITLGVACGLVLGKPLGIFSATYLACKLLKTQLIHGVSWQQIMGVGFLGGIGFTMSLFIANLSFTEAAHLEYAKVGIMIGSFVSALTGYVILRKS